MSQPRLIVLAGPNGAGKSTFFEVHLRQTALPFVNADVIARAISPTDSMKGSYAAAKAADLEREALLARGDSFCTETVFSDPVGAKLTFLRRAHASGFHTHLIFIGIDSVELSAARVSARVAGGGHDVPDEKLLERFPRILRNLRAALPLVDEADLYDNASADEPFRPFAHVVAGSLAERRPPIPEWATPILESLS